MIIFYAFVVRFFGINFGLPYLHHWDESQTASTALQMLKTGDLNPHFFLYPGFLIYSCLAIDIAHYYDLMGRKTSDSDYLRNLNEIVTNRDTNWPWTISHPSFYLWNRAFIVVLGVISVLLTYVIANDVYGRKAGILAALLLSGSSFHVEQSRYITPDMPSAFFVLLVLLFSLRYNRSHRFRDLLLSVVSAGFAMSCKYNMVFCLAIPLGALIINIKHVKANTRLLHIGLILTLPFIVFLILNPFLLSDFKLFLSDTGDQLRVYAGVLGEGEAASPPPLSRWDHFILQMGNIRTYQSGLLFYLALLGILILVRRPQLVFLLLIFPLLHTYVLTKQIPIYHRNYLVLYPLLAIFSAVALVFLTTKISQLGALINKRHVPQVRGLRNILPAVFILLLTLAIFPGYLKGLKDSYALWKTSETRTQAVDCVNSMIAGKEETQIVVGIANELRIHRLDLIKLKTEYLAFDHQNIAAAKKECDYLLVGEYESSDGRWRVEDQELNELTPKDLIGVTIGEGKTRRDVLSVNPKVIILINPQKSIIRIRSARLREEEVDLGEGPVFMAWGGRLTTKNIWLEKSKYEISISSKGNSVLGETARFKVYLGDELIGEYFTSTEYQEKKIQFTSQRRAHERLILEYTNDYFDQDKQLDRNAWIESIAVSKIE